MEEAHARKCHRDAIFVASLYDIIVADTAACLCDIFHSTLVSALDVVAEREKRVRAKRSVGHCVKPLALLFLGEHLGLNLDRKSVV